jgi:hypothetical protein
LNQQLDHLEREVQALSGSPARARLRDEAIAAEYVATEETIENVGTALAAMERLQEIQRRYWQQLLQDHRATFEAVIEVRSPLDLNRVGFEHWQRRVTHTADAIRETASVLADELRSFSNTFVDVWTPFAALVRRDWSGR